MATNPILGPDPNGQYYQLTMSLNESGQPVIDYGEVASPAPGSVSGTYTWQNLVDRVKLLIKGVPVGDSNWVLFCDMVNSDIYTSYPWKDSMQNLAGVIPLVDNQQDYGIAPTIYRVTKANIVRTDTTPNQSRELNIETDLDDDFTKRSWQTIQAVSRQAGTPRLRLDAPVEIPDGVVLELRGEFQAAPTKITDLSDVVWFRDVYADVALHGLLYWGYQYADDARAGTAQTNDRGDITYSGQLAVYKAALKNMEKKEEYGANETYYPSEPMGSDRDSGWQLPNIYGR